MRPLRNGRLFVAIEKRYGAYIRRIAASNVTGILEAVDVHSEIVLQLHRAVTSGRLDFENESHVKQQAKSRAIDLIRRELRQTRVGGNSGGLNLDRIVADGNRLRQVVDRPTCGRCGGERLSVSRVGNRAYAYCQDCRHAVSRELPPAY